MYEGEMEHACGGRGVRSEGRGKREERCVGKSGGEMAGGYEPCGKSFVIFEIRKQDSIIHETLLLPFSILACSFVMGDV